MPGETNKNKPATFSSVQLRLIAEAASGQRGEEITFVLMEDGSIRERRGPGGPHGVLEVPAYTENDTPNQPPLVEATLKAQGTEAVNLLDLPDGLGAADAVFWSKSAVEKFMVPYYASVYGDQAGKAVEDLLWPFRGDRKVTKASSDSGAVRATGDDVQVYAMAHLPKSEYVLVGGESDIGTDTTVLFRESSSQVMAALTLRKFLLKFRDH